MTIIFPSFRGDPEATRGYENGFLTRGGFWRPYKPPQGFDWFLHIVHTGEYTCDATWKLMPVTPRRRKKKA